MNRNADWPAILVMTSLVFGAVLRFVPAISNGFPLNDGGMFHVMILDLKANHYLLPHTTTYNHAGIPFAYPPLGFYIAAVLSDLSRIPALTILLWLPAVVNTFSIFIFYKLAEGLLPSRVIAALAALIYALSPRAFLWQVMGGGITRSFGMLFLMLMAWQAVAMFREYSHKRLLLTTLCGMGSVLSHPQTALHAALVGALIFLVYGWNRRGFASAISTALGVVILAVPWWGTVLARHGFEPLLSAGQTSRRTIEAYLEILQFRGLGDYLFLPTLLLAIVGTWFTIKQRRFLLVAWILVAYLADPRGAAGIASLPLAMLAGEGLYRFAARLSRSKEVPFRQPAARGMVVILTTYWILAGGIFDFQLINTSLKQGDLEMIEWVKRNISGGKTFLLASGREYSMSDPLQEWFPALTGQYSATTMQGLEWTLGDRFFPWYEQVIAFQHCADVDCALAWDAHNHVNHDYLVVLIPRAEDRRGLAISLGKLGGSARASASYRLIHESGSAMIFELKK